MLSDTGTGIAGNAPVATAVTVPVRTPIDTGAGTAGATPVALATMRGVVICIGPVAAATGAEPAGVLELLLGLLLGTELGLALGLGLELALRLGAGRFGIATVGTLFGIAGPGVKETWGDGVAAPAVIGAFLPGGSFVAA